MSEEHPKGRKTPMSAYTVEHTPARQSQFSRKTIRETWRLRHIATGSCVGIYDTEAEALAAQAEKDATKKPATSQPTRSTAGRSHPLGRAIEAGDGYTIYED